MKIFIGSDHRGWKLKNGLTKFLSTKGFLVTDTGNIRYDSNDDYPDFARSVARNVQRSKNTRGIVLCGSGAGICIGANRYKGIRAVLALDPKLATVSRCDDDTNILCLGADFLNLEEAKRIVTVWLKTKFSGNKRYIRRIRKLDKIAF